MSDTVPKPWSINQFFAWQCRQQERYERVGGFPLRMMAGAPNVHNDIVINILGERRSRLRGSFCHPFNGDSSIETIPGQIRRPDAGVDCGPRDPNALKAAQPRMVAQVLSPRTRDFDTFEKLDQYKHVESLDTIMFVEPNAPEVAVWSRAADRTWLRQDIVGLQAAIDLPTIGITLPLTEILRRRRIPGRPSSRPRRLTIFLLPSMESRLIHAITPNGGSDV
jgi:Uma2 family endonuclease